MKMRWISLFQLGVLMLALTYALTAQPVSMQSTPKSTIDALQDERILNVRTSTAINSQRIDDLTMIINELRESVNRGTGAVIGFGLALTVLQAFHTVAAWRKGK